MSTPTRTPKHNRSTSDFPVHVRRNSSNLSSPGLGFLFSSPRIDRPQQDIHPINNSESTIASIDAIEMAETPQPGPSSMEFEAPQRCSFSATSEADMDDSEGSKTTHKLDTSHSSTSSLKRKREDVEYSPSIAHRPKKMRMVSPVVWKVSQDIDSASNSAAGIEDSEEAKPLFQEAQTLGDISAITTVNTTIDMSTVVPESLDSIRPLTVPQSPDFLTSKRASVRNSVVYKAEVVNEDHLAPFSTHIRKKRRLSTKRVRVRALGPCVLPARSSRPLTQPITPTLRAEKRIRLRQKVAQSQAHAQVEAVQAEKAAPERHWTGELTQPQPFQLASDQRAKIRQATRPTEPISPYKPFREEVEKYLREVPERFRTKPSQPPPSHPLSLTRPEEFHFHTDQRAQTKPKPSLEEEQRMREAEMKPFKAQPFNHKIFENAGELGVPRVPKRPLTKPSPFALHTDERASLHPPKETEVKEEAPKGFKARPIDERIFHGPVGLPSVEHRTLTVPESPSFGAKPKAIPVPQEEEVHGPGFKARPMPDFSKAMTLAKPIEHRPITEPEPFNLKTEVRGEVKEQELKRMIQEEEESLRKAREFKAGPVRNYDTRVEDDATQLPAVEKRSLTRPSPFKLESEVLHEHHKIQFANKVKEEEEQLKNARKFKATPMFKGKPFVPQPSSRPLTEVKDVKLNTVQRAKRREQFESIIQEKLSSVEEQRRLKQKMEEEAAERERAELRAKATFKATPMPNFSKPASAPPRAATKLTIPTTPKLRTSQRKKVIRMM